METNIYNILSFIHILNVRNPVGRMKNSSCGFEEGFRAPGEYQSCHMVGNETIYSCFLKISAQQVLSPCGVSTSSRFATYARKDKVSETIQKFDKSPTNEDVWIIFVGKPIAYTAKKFIPVQLNQLSMANWPCIPNSHEYSSPNYGCFADFCARHIGLWFPFLCPVSLEHSKFRWWNHVHLLIWGKIITDAVNKQVLTLLFVVVVVVQQVKFRSFLLTWGR